QKMSSKPRPVVPPKPARLSVNSQKRDSTSSVTSFTSSVASPVSKIPLCSSPPPTFPESPDDRTPRASEIFTYSEGRQARALYNFEGESYQELSFRAGDVLYILNEKLSEGWSLAEKDGITGLIPESYITYTTEFTELPNCTLSGTLSDRDSMDSAASTPAKNGSMSESIYSSTCDSTNGSIRGSKIIGKRQFNRFSWFVTTGVEEFILNGWQPDNSISTSPENGEEVTESDKHFIQSGPSWHAKAPSFEIMVHNPEKRVKLGGVQEYTIFHVTSVFSGVRVTVERRYSQFEWLYKRLVSKFGCFVLPPLPEKQYSGRFNEEFIEKRRRALEVFINRLARHPVIRYSDLLTHFLNCDNDSEWNKREKEFESDKLVGRAIFQNVYHPEFNVDDGDIETMERFAAHARAMEKLMPWINDASQAHKDSLEEMKRQYRQVSFALLRLITGKSVGEGNECVNEDGAWCWKDGCNACLSLTKALQYTVESMQTIADMYDSYTKETVIPWIESYKMYSQPATDYEPLIDMHNGTYRKYKEVSDENLSLEQSEDLQIETIRSRCDTVFNVTLAEVNRIHDERVRDFQGSTKQYLDGQIEFHEKVLEELRQARANFDEPHYSALSQTPRTPSLYEDLIDEQRPILSRPVSSVGSMSDVVGGVVGSVESMGNFLKKTARTSIGRSSWWGGN
ncbi:11391_t:CDS:10, partial [Acaulospora morrowiae]